MARRLLEQRKANQVWNDAARSLGFRRSNEQWRAADRARARTLFLEAIDLDPKMSDAWLGLHACGYQPDVALDRMTESVSRFGEQRRLNRRQLKSRYAAGFYCRFDLDDWESLYLAQAARIAEFTGFFLLGKLIEFDKTEVIFKRPAKKETEDYITGRFG